MRGLDRVAADRRALVASQVRCSTGFTWGRAVAGVAHVMVPGPGGTLRAPVRAKRAMPADLPERLMTWLRERDRRRFLPAEGALPDALGVGGADEGPAWVAAAWAALELRGAVRVHRGRRTSFAGQWLVLVVETGAVHRTDGAPIAWAEAMRGAGR
jgi:hypothetical protein